MTEQSHTSSLSGRELSRARRRAMSSTGAGSSLAGSAQRTAATQQTAPATEMGGTPLTGAALSRARRAMLAKGGKSAVGTTAPVATATPATPVQQAHVEHDKEEPCCDACAAENRTMPCESCDTTEVASAAPADASSEALDSLCDIIETSSSTNASSSVRDYCRQRRSQLSQKGKLALTGTAGRQARKSIMRQSAGSSLTGRALAKMQREDRCQFGRGDTSACRPSGRVRSTGSAPAKVEVGTTLSGQEVTGTQVEQSGVITGIESGSCRAITGTEYLGAEQFANFCSSTPEAPAAKVALSETSHGQIMTGTSTSGNTKVTGDEAGSCKSVTGSEYLGVEHFGAFCGSQGMSKGQTKVVAGHTGKDIRITGADEARDNAVTGSESGSHQSVTGTDYTSSNGLKKKVSNVPAKVAVSHTAAGMVVSGGESSRVAGVTGDEQGSCGRVTGTEYVSSERFVSACGTAPAGSVAKVGANASDAGMMITGNLVDRTESVTGNEPGSCQRVTGSQYSEAAALCGNRQNKVQQMHTLQGGSLTGTEASPSPKLTGDDRGGCAAVTGSEYISQEHFKQSCSQTPEASSKRTGLSQTWNNQLVSGVQTGHSQRTTGDEQGICNTVTGSSYAGREQVGEFCGTSAVAQGDQRLAHHATSVMPVSGIGPGVDERFAGNSQRGVCQNISGTPYQGHENVACNTGNTHHLAQAPLNQPLPTASVEAAPYHADFSVVSPAKAAWQQRSNSAVHSSVSGTGGPITGVVNKAEGVISGTPEFRHQQFEPAVAVVAEPVAVQRAVTGEGSEAGTRITGDDWSRGGFVTGTEGMFSARRNQTQRGASVERDNIGAHALKDREPREVSVSRVTGSSGNSKAGAAVTLSGGAGA